MVKEEKVLIIEGDESFGDQIANALKKDGYNTIVVRTGAEGMKTMLQIEPDLVLLDITLPDTDSYKLLNDKQKEPMLADIPTFLMSAQGVPINMRRVPEGSVSEFLMALHSNPDDIVSKVNRHFSHEEILIKTDNNNIMKKKILWVEDDKLIGTILAKKLIASDFDLFHAKSGEEALEALKQTMPDVIVLDLLLPGMNGFDILTKIKEDSGLKDIPVMILSNLSKPSDIDRAKTLGAKRFLIKAASSLEDIVREIKVLCA